MKLDEGWVECIYNHTRFLGFPFRRLSAALRSCFKPLDDVRVRPRLASSSFWRAFSVAWRTQCILQLASHQQTANSSPAEGKYRMRLD